MTLSALWPLFLLPLIGVIIIFYLLKQPSKEKLLSSLTFWQSAYRQQHSQKPWEKFRQDLLMYLQILAILFLIISLCAPVIKSTRKTEQLMLIFDTSASMQTLYSADGTTRLEQAKKEAKKLIEDSENNVEVTIVTCADDAQILLNNSTNNQTILSALGKLEASDCAGTLNNAISLCESIYSQWEDGSCVFFTDSGLNTKSLPAQIYDLSTSAAAPEEDYLNYNLTACIYDVKASDDDSFSIGALLHNYGDFTVEGEINFYMNNTLVDVQDFSVEEGRTLSLNSMSLRITEETVFPLLLKMEIVAKDALAADNTAYFVYYGEDIGNTKEPQILLASRQNSFLESALSTCLQTASDSVYKITTMDDYHPAEEYDLYIFDGIFPDELPETGSVILLPNSKDMEESSEAFSRLLPDAACEDIIKNKYLNLTESPFSTNLDNVSFPVMQTLSFSPPADAEDVFRLDNGGTCGYLQRSGGRTFTVFGFDLHDTDFPLQTDFPILMFHVFRESLTQHDFSEPAYNNGIWAGDTITYYPAAAGKKVSIRNENGTEVKSLTPSSALSATTVLETCGIYDFYTKSAEHHAYLAVNFPLYGELDESNILAVPVFLSSEDGTTEMKQITTGYSVPVQKVFIFLVLFLIIIEFILWLHRQWSRLHRPFFLAMRTLLVLLLCLSLADIQVTLGKSTETTLFLADVSDSMKHNLSDLETALNQAVSKLPKDSEAGIIAFGTDSRVEHFISDKVHFSQLETTPVTSATNLENALQTAITMFSDNDSKRIVLLTDGRENEGTVKNMASALNEHNITLKVMNFSQDSHEEVLVSNVQVPEKLSIGETFQAEVTVISNVNTDAVLSLYSGDTLKGTKQISLTNGTNRFLFQDTLTKKGLTGYRVIIEPAKDTETLNNEYLTFTQAEAKQKLLLIEGREGEAAEFKKLLDAAGFSYKTVLPVSAPRKLLSLKQYPVVICANVHADDLPDGFKNILESYVEDGGGFIATGGDNSFALGNYKNTSLETVLPVNSILQGTNTVPETAMALVIDHSGSMSGGNKYVTRLDLAKEAAVSALNSLRETDSIGVLAFDDSYDWVVPFTKASETETVQQGISSITLQGGTSIYPAVDEAIKKLAKQSAKLKHIILLTDGQDGFHEYEDLYAAMKKENITLSTVAVSDGADTMLLESMAEKGGGRYYYADISTDIPRIFAQEVFLSSDSYLVNREFTPEIMSSSMISITEPLLEEELPSLYGYIRTTQKPDSSALITSDSGDPILAVNNVGLGVAAAFTTDITNEWTKDFAGLSNYASFWKKLINHCILDITEYDSSVLTVTAEGDRAHISYQSPYESGSLSYAGNPEVPREITGTCTDEDGNSIEVSFTSKRTDAVSPIMSYAATTYEADIELPHSGIYSLTITDTDGTTTVVETAAFASTYSREYELYDDSSTLDALISLTNAEVITDTDAFFTGELKRTSAKHSMTPLLLLLVLLFFLADIAMRRFGIPDGLRLVRYGMEKFSRPGSGLRGDKLRENDDGEGSSMGASSDRGYMEGNEANVRSPKNPDMDNNSEKVTESGSAANSNKSVDSDLEKGKDKKRQRKQKSPELLDTSMLLTSRKPKKK